MVIDWDERKNSGENQFLFLDKVPNSPSLLNGFTTSNEIRVELQQWSDFVHIHYKNIRLEFTVDEAKEFIKTLSDSLEGIEKTSSQIDRVKRIGFNNRAVPSLVEGDLENSEFWSKWEDAKELENPFLTTLIGDDQNKYVEEEERKSGEDSIFGFYVDDLFLTSLYKQTHKNEFGFVNNKFLPLENRYQFARLVIEKNYNLTDEEIKSTPYFKLLTQNFSDHPRDGSKYTVYKDPLGQAKRFIHLIKDLKEGKLNLKTNINKFLSESGPAVHQFEDGKEHTHEGKNKYNENMVTCLAVDTSIVVNDGLHRIAALKALKDMKVLDIETIDCYLLNSNEIHGNSFFGLLKMFLRNLEPRKGLGLGLKFKIKRIFGAN